MWNHEKKAENFPAPVVMSHFMSRGKLRKQKRAWICSMQEVNKNLMVDMSGATAYGMERDKNPGRDQGGNLQQRLKLPDNICM